MRPKGRIFFRSIMRVLITGGLGFVGLATCKELIASGHEVFVSTHRNKDNIRHIPENITLLDTQSTFPKVDAIVNLAGASIAQKILNKKRCLELLKTRVKVMDLLLSKYPKISFPKIFIQTSATGIYTNGQICAEDGDTCGAFSELISALEQATLERFAPISQVTLLRLGVVMGKNGGLGQILKYLPPLKIIPDPGNLVPWVYVEDVAKVIALLLNKPCSGVVNVASDDFKTANELLALNSHTTFALPLPAFLLKLPFDKRGALLMASHKVLSLKLSQMGFKFTH